MPESFDFLHQRLKSLVAEHAFRSLRSVPLSGQQPSAGADSKAAAKPLVNFGSNDYLGLAAKRFLSQAAPAHGSGASPLVCGYSDDQKHLCQLIARLEQTEAAVLFPSGYAACSGAAATLPQAGDLILSDQLNHASLIDGCRLSAAEKIIYPHRDTDAVENLLATHRQRYKNVWIITDSVFGMDGVLAPLPQLCDLADRYDAILLVDEAHATGVLGHDGSGATAHLDVKSRVAIRIGTLSKAIGAHGGFVAGPQVVIDYLINFCRPLIFSTAASPLAIVAAIDGVQAIGDQPHLRKLVRAHARSVRIAIGLNHQPATESEIPIIPVMIGGNEQTLGIAYRAAQAGFFIPAIRPPTVPQGTSRLRISISASHTQPQIDELIGFLKTEMKVEDPIGKGF
ncbi:MAG TPA: 8-amino-7-oxononanoate synthase [Planctomycetaceae bacterium]|nr:8-amino-7-oxononanoate synthase [Planctomycetaceae bacterium]